MIAPKGPCSRRGLSHPRLSPGHLRRRPPTATVSCLCPYEYVWRKQESVAVAMRPAFGESAARVRDIGLGDRRAPDPGPVAHPLTVEAGGGGLGAHRWTQLVDRMARGAPVRCRRRGAGLAGAADASGLGRVDGRHAPRDDVAAGGRPGDGGPREPRDRVRRARLPGPVPRRSVGGDHLDPRGAALAGRGPAAHGHHRTHRCARAVGADLLPLAGGRRADDRIDALPGRGRRRRDRRILAAWPGFRLRIRLRRRRMHANRRRRARGAHAARRSVALQRGAGMASGVLRHAPGRARVGR